MSDTSLLDQVQQQVADRQPVDWEGLMAQLHADHVGPDEIQAFSLLRLLDEVALVHTSFQTGGSDSAESTIPVPQPVADDTLESWGRYRLDQKVGRGGFGSVYRAWDPSLQMPVAIKILHRRFSDERLQDRLLHEGRTLAQVNHPNVVRVLNVEQHDGRLGLVMEFVSGETLDALVATQGKLNDREATLVGEDVCRALVAVHAIGLIHRDVKARNIIRERAGRIVLMDFGAGLSTTAVQEEGRAVGTPLYMAPENLAGKPSTVASDVYSLGVLLFYLVTARHPYEGVSLEEIREAQAAGRPQSLLGLRPDLPMAFVTVVERAVAIAPAERYPTPADVLRALVDSRTPPAAPVPVPGWSQRLLRIGVGLGLLLVLVLVGGLLSTASFNATLGRSEYVQESWGTWLEYGVRPLALPVSLALFGTLAVGLAVAIRNAMVRASVRVRSVDRYVGNRCSALARRLALTEPGVSSCWLVVLTAVVAGSIWLSWIDLWQAIMGDISWAPREMLAILSPPFRQSLTNHRMLLSLLAAVNLIAWYGLTRAAAAVGERLPLWFTATEVALLMLLYAFMLLPYRIGRDSDIFEQVTWRNERCFVLGERSTDALLFCPSLMPRRQAVPITEVPATRIKAGVSLFESFAPK